MKKGILKLSILGASVVFLNYGFTHPKVYDFHEKFKVDEALNYTVKTNDAAVLKAKAPFLGKSFVGFKEALGFKESRGNYGAINQLGYLGKYQFGASTLRVIGIDNVNFFLNNPELQERAFIANLERNKWVLRKDIKRSVGKTIAGIKVTESGILAAAHLAGPGNVKSFLRHGVGFKDANGASIRYYMRKFAGFDVSFIQANKNARIVD
ncbi:peptidoglycan-binding protein LysM [Zhouia sp. PK063]|uniref:peptidoglycan-binding protein LysM n=1 Tax=Zhouia sp. PK063 TaxID=3373602 RepID=UPI0037ACAC24